MKGRAPEPSHAKSSISECVQHTNKEVTTMKMNIEQKRRERVELQDDRLFLVSKVYYDHTWYIFYGVEQKSREISFYSIKIHHNVPGFLIQEPSFIQQQSNPEQSQPMGRHHQNHNQVAKHGQKWIRSPAKSLSIQEQSYPVQEGSFRNRENQFQFSSKKKHNSAALIRLFNLLLKSQSVQEQSQPLGRHQSHEHATSHQ